MSDHAGRGDLGRAVDNAADDGLGGDRLRDYAARVDGLEHCAVERTAVRLEVPPRDAVLAGDDRCVRPEERAEVWCNLGQAVGLEAEEYDVRILHHVPVVGCLGICLEVAAIRQDADTPLLKCLQVRSTSDERHVRAAPCECGADVGADRARTDDNELHAPLPVSCCPIRARWSLPVGVRGISSRTKIFFGTLNAASRSPHQVRSAASSLSPTSTTAAPTSSP